MIHPSLLLPSRVVFPLTPRCFVLLSSHIPPARNRYLVEAAAAAAGGDGGGGGASEEKKEEKAEGRRKANLVARRREKIRLPHYHYCYSGSDSKQGRGGGGGGGLSIGDFLGHPSGVLAILNTRALQCFELIDDSSNTYRCTLPQLSFLKFQVSPVLDLRVTRTPHDCTVEMLACKFEGSKEFEQQNQLFSASMTNYITWDENGSNPCLDVDVSLKVTLEVYTKPFSLLPISAVEKPGNLLMQGLVDRLVPLLIEQLLSDYNTWVQEQFSSALE